MVGVGGGVVGFSHQICTDLKNGPVELQKAVVKSLKKADPCYNLAPALSLNLWQQSLSAQETLGYIFLETKVICRVQ